MIGFLTLIESAFSYSNLIFITLAESQAGDNDILLSPVALVNSTLAATSGLQTITFLNYTQINNQCNKMPQLAGCAAR